MKNIELTSVHVQKQWSQGLEDYITVRLIINDVPSDTIITISAGTDTDGSGGWNNDFEGLAKYDAEGNEINYYVKEEAIYSGGVDCTAFYKNQVVPDSSNPYSFTIFNSYSTAG
ncbi:MAG: Cna B-type domain-containing protein [Oscillospiraceae bacterium]